MFRKIALALGATAVIGAAALTPTTASAWHHGHHGHHGHWHGGFGLGVGIVAPATIYRFRLLRREEGRQHPARPASSPRHGLRLTTSHGRVLTPASQRRSRGYPLPVLP